VGGIYFSDKLHPAQWTLLRRGGRKVRGILPHLLGFFIHSWVVIAELTMKVVRYVEKLLLTTDVDAVLWLWL
jgi:hypothetical protein